MSVSMLEEYVTASGAAPAAVVAAKRPLVVRGCGGAPVLEEPDPALQTRVLGAAARVHGR